MKKVFLDTEFTGLHQNTTLFSLALVDEDDRMFYAEFTDYDKNQVTAWHEANVLPKLSGINMRSDFKEYLSVDLFYGVRKDVRPILIEWFSGYKHENSVQIWADVLAWDWVLFCELFGGAFEIPRQIFYIPGDLSTLLWARGFDPDKPRQEITGAKNQIRFHGEKFSDHHALQDAIVLKNVFFDMILSPTKTK